MSPKKSVDQYIPNRAQRDPREGERVRLWIEKTVSVTH